jgi:hypothetical protein
VLALVLHACPRGRRASPRHRSGWVRLARDPARARRARLPVIPTPGRVVRAPAVAVSARGQSATH